MTVFFSETVRRNTIGTVSIGRGERAEPKGTLSIGRGGRVESADGCKSAEKRTGGIAYEEGITG